MPTVWGSGAISDAVVYIVVLAAAANEAVFSMTVDHLSPSLSWNEVTFWTSVGRSLLSLPLLIYEQVQAPLPTVSNSVENLQQSKCDEVGQETAVKIPEEEEEQFSIFCFLTNIMVPFSVMSGLMLVFRNLTSVLCGSMTINYGLSHLPISTVAALESTSALLTVLFGAIFLKEYVSCLTLFLIVLGFVGVLLIFQPLELLGLFFFGNSSLTPMAFFASVVVLLGAAGTGLQSVLQRGWKWSVWLSICSAGLTGIIVTLIIDRLVLTDRNSCWEWVREEAVAKPFTTFSWILILCLTSFNRSMCMNYVLKEASCGVTAGTIETVYRCSTITLQTVLQIMFFDDVVTACVWAGVALMVISCVGIVHSKESTGFEIIVDPSTRPGDPSPRSALARHLGARPTPRRGTRIDDRREEPT
jgi:drug/metabolite transporter (DMT)-like permease